MSEELPALLALAVRKIFRPVFGGGGATALDGLDLRLEPGCVLGMLGANASGKSTTLRILAGLVAPDAGRAEVFGFPAGSVEARARLGYLPDRDVFYGYLTPRENLVLAASLRGLGRGESRRRADRLLERFGLSESAGIRCAALSKGLRRRLGLAISLAGEPDLLLWDEPWDGLDPAAAAILTGVIAELRARGAAILMAGHLIPDLLDNSDRLLLLERGRVAASGPAAGFTLEGLFARFRAGNG
ncbi:MAG: ABC transporter ATP-binding protein [Planctomycetota bacterium]|nr:ABC transporter ATP-binding protein [Planctomycetota bacterium]